MGPLVLRDVAVCNVTSTSVVLRLYTEHYTTVIIDAQIKQLRPEAAPSTLSVCCPADPFSPDQFHLKVCALAPGCEYVFVVRCRAQGNDTAQYCEYSRPVKFTTHVENVAQYAYPHRLPAPTDLQVIEMRCDAVVFAWNYSDAQLWLSQDMEFVLFEQRCHGNTAVASVEDERQLEVRGLSPSTDYAFVLRAKMYDSRRVLSDSLFDGTAQFRTFSSASNCVSLRTPTEHAGVETSPCVDNVIWKRQDGELRLSWSAPLTFSGSIRYELSDAVESVFLGQVDRLPAVLPGLGRRGDYVLAICAVISDAEAQEARGKDVLVEVKMRLEQGQESQIESTHAEDDEKQHEERSNTRSDANV